METVQEIIEKVTEEICDKYCKYNTEINALGRPLTPEEEEKFYHEHCDNCPLNKLC